MNYNKMNEASVYNTTYGNADIIEELGEVDVFDVSKKEFIKMNPAKLIKVISDAMYKMQRDYTYLYQFFKKCKVMYIPTWPSEITDTMAVDPNNNLWINFYFIYNNCKMDPDLAFGILFHELFHIFLEHLMRFNKIYPPEVLAGMENNIKKRANTKANICMDYEVNSSMVEDGIVSAAYWKEMNGCYKQKYTGMTWEEIWRLYGDQEYNEWLEKNGLSISSVEEKVLDAIEKASQVLLDPDADDNEKKYARKELQKTLDKLLGRQKTEEQSLQDYFDELAQTKLADNGDIALDLDDISSDLNRDISQMSGEELDKTLKDMNKLIDDIEEYADDIGDQFNKSGQDVAKDAEKARKTMKEAMKKLNEEKLSKEEKKDLIDQIKDTMEDIISDDVEKERLKKKREETDAKKEAERIEKLKKSHPCRKLIIVMNNLIELNNIPIGGAMGAGVGSITVKKSISLVSDKTVEVLKKCIADLEPLTAKRFDEFKKSDLRDLSNHLDELKDALLPDLVELINNETILQKTEDDMKKLLDGVFEYIFNAFRRIFDTSIDNEAKGALMTMAAQKLRIIGKVLKTQKKWRVGDDFKKAYMEEMKRLMEIRKKGGDAALMKELIDKGVIQPLYLDEKSMELYTQITGKGRYDDLMKTLKGLSGIGDDSEEEEDEWTYEDIKKDLAERMRKSGMSEEDIDEFEEVWDNKVDELEDEKTPGDKIYHGTLYYNVHKDDDYELGITLELSDIPDGLEDSDYEKFAKKFKKDFPEYQVEEEMESVFSVYYNGSSKQPSMEELKKKLENHPDYEQGDWGREDEK